MRAGRPPVRDLGEAERDQRRRDRAAPLPRRARRRADRSGRARYVRAAAGDPGVSETIRVSSIVGRFLEHSRMFAFTNGGAREVYIGSADWMGRNLDRRVETVVPVLDPVLGDMICDEILALLLADN